jgi:eukaryotic-like serine/threonine-protein kinase
MAISPEKWETVKACFDAAMELNSTARSAFLRDNCPDAEARAEVERLLNEYDQAGAFLSTPALGNFLLEDEAPTVSTPRLSEGEVLSGRFRIVRLIAGGGMGEVYEAEDQELRERVAIKTVRPEILAQPISLTRFKREVSLARQVTHPNVCRTFDLFRHKPDGTGVQEEIVFISMELLDGETLGARLKDGGRMSVDEALPLVRQMASALAAAHAVGIMHRDFKPGNVMLVGAQGKCRTVVTDFGLALQSLTLDQGASLSIVHGLSGTPAYMSPEQIEGRPATIASDIYALGLVIYEMVTGARPFQGDTPISAALKRLSEAPTPPRKFQPELSPLWESVIVRCLERDPEKRFATAAEVAGALAVDHTEESPTLSAALLRQSKRPSVAIPVLLILLTLGSLSAWWLQRSFRARWAREQALPQIAQLVEEGKRGEAYALAVQAERYIPDDPMLAKLWPAVSMSGSIETTPLGVSVFRKNYNAPGDPWELVGRSPIEKMRFPLVFSRWKFEAKGFATVDRATFPHNDLMVTMDDEAKVPTGMVHVEFPTSTSPQSTPVTLLGLPGLEDLPAVPLGDYWIDKYEVTNGQFKQFLDQGGYRKQEYWRQEFRKDSRQLSWAEAMSLFRDTTGRAGPATWVQGEYPQGQESFPVTGVSWYEAAAYAEFAGKMLPTIYHWAAAAAPKDASRIIPASNFSGQGPARVGKYVGMSWSGAYDMAGNVKEWIWNEANSGKRYILGGAWDEPTYMFTDVDARSPFDRSANFGFRCAKYVSAGEAASAADPVTLQLRDFSREKPVSEPLFNAYKSLYSYDKTPLHAVVESTDQTDDWKEEKITFAAAYGNERVIAYLFLPRKASPPFQTVVYFPGADTLRIPSSANTLDLEEFEYDFIIKSGRAVLFPLYKGTYERGDDYKGYHRATSSYRDHVIAWSKDLGRSIDYLETRPDIDSSKLAYEGSSWGGAMGSLLPAVEDRFKALVLINPGFYLSKTLPEVDQLNFAPRVKAPILMLNGRYDFIFPVGPSQEPMFRLVGTPKENKRRVVFETGHNIPLNEVTKETLNWLDRYLGPVR